MLPFTTASYGLNLFSGYAMHFYTDDDNADELK